MHHSADLFRNSHVGAYRRHFPAKSALKARTGFTKASYCVVAKGGYGGLAPIGPLYAGWNPKVRALGGLAVIYLEAGCFRWDA